MTPPPDHPKWPIEPFSTPTPEKDLYPDDEVSKVTNLPQMYRKMEKLDRMLNRMSDPISQIPEVREKVEHIGERVTRVEERLTVTKERVDVLNGAAKKPHDCFQVDTIEKVEVAALSLQRDRLDDTKKIVRVEASVDAMVSQVEEIKKNTKEVKDVRRQNHYFWVGTIAGFLLAVLSAVWYLRGLSAAVEFEARDRAEQFRQVELVLNKVSEQSDTEPVVQQIKQLQTSMDQEANPYEDLCEGLSPEQKARIRVVLTGKQLPASCRSDGSRSVGAVPRIAVEPAVAP